MAATHLRDTPLNVQLFKEDDDQDDLAHKKIIHALITGAVTPAAAARDFDAWVMAESSRRHEKLALRADWDNLTAEEQASGMTMRMLTPNASGYIEDAFTTLAKLLPAFPPAHEGQDRIVQFLLELRALPRHDAPDSIADAEAREVRYIKLWPFGGNWQATAELYRWQAADVLSNRSEMQKLHTETRARWCNLQSAMARLTSESLIDCSFLCSLDDIMPQNCGYPSADGKARETGDMNRLSADAVAGAQWVLRTEEGRWVYARCREESAGIRQDTGEWETEERCRRMWSLERWSEWKRQFRSIASDDQFDKDSRGLVQLAVERMEEYEADEYEADEYEADEYEADD
ncbi:hypothetical protein F4803DRAFT_554544 [Xylaria telfairii]|nr:hypothetical protein F4803DRAFT_554544 [Xylaria telfairii]